MKVCIILLPLAVVTAGCVSPLPPLPPETQGVALVPVSSENVTVREPTLQVYFGKLRLVGTVHKALEGESTHATHLDVVFLDRSGRVLGQELTSFYPQRLSSTRTSHNGRGRYSVEIKKIPTNATRIEVRAHDGLH